MTRMSHSLSNVDRNLESIAFNLARIAGSLERMVDLAEGAGRIITAPVRLVRW